jgi:hypothetical protein
MSTPTLTANPTPDPNSSNPSTGLIVGVAIGAGAIVCLIAFCCWWCCCGCFGPLSNSSRRRASKTSASASASSSEPEQGIAGLELDSTGRDRGTEGEQGEEEAPPAYYTVVGAGAGTQASGSGTGTRDRSRDRRVEDVEAGLGGGVVANGMGRSLNLRVNTDGPSAREREEWSSVREEGEEGLDRSMTYSSYSVREAALGTVAMPSVVNRGRSGKGGES